MTSFHHRIKSGKKGTAARHAAYISRKGKYSRREDLVYTGYGNLPEWTADDPSVFWEAADGHERANGAAYRGHEIALPAELTRDQNKELVHELIATLASNKPYQFAIHEVRSSLEGATNTHLHLMYSDRMPDGIERSPEQTFSRYNGKHPERGGCKKDSGGRNRMELRDHVIETRKKCADLQNEALMKYGHADRVDHRTLREQGIDRLPERHLGPARIRNMTLEDKEQYIEARKNYL